MPATSMRASEASTWSHATLRTVASVRLTRGSSPHAARVLDAAEGKTMLQIGSSSRCNWQIRAASVPAHAFSLTLVKEGVFARCGTQGGVTMNGRPLARSWVQVDDHARFDIGLACIEVTLGQSSTHALDVQDLDALCDDAGVLDLSAEETAAAESSAFEDRATQVFQASHDEDAARAIDDAPERLSFMGRFSRASFEALPSVLGKGLKARGMRIGRYGLLACAVVAAYVSWLALLERL